MRGPDVLLLIAEIYRFLVDRQNLVHDSTAVWLLSAFMPSAFARLLDAQALQGLLPGVAGPSQNRPKVRKRRRFAPESPAERLLWTLGCELWSAGRDMALAGGSVAKGDRSFGAGIFEA
eukprot:s570_g6.t1